jgi:1-acyl-sn-glycerol-3-phosphate acyltransferase
VNKSILEELLIIMKFFHMQRERNWSNQNQVRNAREGWNYWAQIAFLNYFSRLRLAMDVAWSGPIPSGPKIFAGNHPTTTDPFYLLLVLHEKTRMMVNADIFKKPILGGLMRRGGHIPVDKKAGASALEAGFQALSRGENIGIYPEGDLSNIEDGISVNKLKTGAVRMALRAGVPIIPVGAHMPVEGMHIKDLVVGGERVESRFYLKGRYALTIGRPMWVGGDVEDRALVRALSANLRERLDTLSQISARRLERKLPLAGKKRRKKKKSIPVEGM